MIQHVFQNCDIGAQPIQFADGNDGFVITITDKDSGHSWQYPCDKTVAKTLGTHLMGLGKLDIPGGDMVERINGHRSDS